MGLQVSHLAHLTTPLGLYEHALGTEPRVEHGFCVDDVARALLVTAREVRPTSEVRRLLDVYLTFVLAAQHSDGLMHNRRNPDGTWGDEASSDDHWGRSLWALGTAVSTVTSPVQKARAREGAAIALRARSPWPRAMAYAALGAAELRRADPSDSAARRMLVDARRVIGRMGHRPSWPWPEPRLTYANAVIPEAMLVIGDALADHDLTEQGLTLLRWLVDEQTLDGHISVVPSGGRDAADVANGVSRRPAFAQQPIEVAALAEACRTAYSFTADERWARVVGLSVAWFEGANDLGLEVRDATTGGGFDGLEAEGVSSNQGAESTLAWLSTEQLATQLQPARLAPDRLASAVVTR
jgi:hypothetical protein